MKLRNVIAVMLLMLTSASFAQMQMPQVPADPDVRVGKLSNGLTYYIRYNNWPEHRANFYIAQKVGSLQEEESQRGLAHFLEHMCFNGTTHFQGNDVISYCEKIGVQFGADLNAYTSIDETVYNIDNVPTTRQSTIDSCLLILADWADGLTLDPKEIDQERGVIHEEWRLRTSASSRMLERNLEKLYPGSKYGKRYPIGLMSVVDNFKPKELRDYYEKWYHPTNQGIIVVGDVDVDKVEAKIKELFGPMTNPKNPAPIVKEDVPDNAQPIVIVDKDKEQTMSVIEVMFKHETFPDSLKGTMAYTLYNYMNGAAMSMLNSRLAEEAQKADCPYIQASVDNGTYLFSKTKDAFSVNTAPKDMSKTADAVKAAFTEARRAAEFGFTATEYARYKADYLSALEKAYSNRDKRPSKGLATQLYRSFLDGTPYPSIDFTYQMMNQLIPSLPLEAINEYMKELLPKSDSNMVVLNFNNEKEGNVYPTEQQIVGAINQARAAEISAYIDNVKNEPLITKEPTPGTIKKETKNAKLGYTKLELSNGVTVFLKQTDFKKDQVILSGEGPGGECLYGEKDYRNLQVFDDVIGMSGLGNFSSTELEKALAGKIANANLTMSSRTMGISGNATPKDVETMMQMLYLYFTNINKDEKSFQKLMNQLEVGLKNRDLVPEQALNDSVTATVYGHNKRMTPLTVDALKDINYDRILEIARERTANANGWTIRILGNFDEATLRPLICKYIASLPSNKKTVKTSRVYPLQKGKIENIFARKQETPKCTAIKMWYSEDMKYTLERDVQASIAGQILQMIYTRDIREKESAAYSVGASGNAVCGDDNYSCMRISAQCPMKPEKKERALYLLDQSLVDMSNNCDATMLNKVKEVMLKRADDAVKANSYWNNVIYMNERYGIDTHTDYKKLIQAQTPASISAYVKQMLSAGNNITVMMTPEN